MSTSSQRRRRVAAGACATVGSLLAIGASQTARATPTLRPRELVHVLSIEYKAPPHRRGLPVMIWGPPGIGKSDIVRQVAQKHGGGLVDLRLSQMEPTDLRGVPFVRMAEVKGQGQGQEGWAIWAHPAMLPNAVRDGQQGILFLDEINTAPPTVSAAGYQLLLDRKLGEYILPEGWMTACAGNREGDHGLTYPLARPLIGRMQHFELMADVDQWVEWAHGRGMHHGVIAFLRNNPEKLMQTADFKTNEPYYSPRGYAFASRTLENHAQSPDHLRLAALQANVGDVAGTQLHAFIKREAELPDIGAVIAGDGKKVAVPRELELQWYTATALVSRGVHEAQKTPKQAKAIYGAILEYVGRFPGEEMQLKTVVDLLTTAGTQQVAAVPQFARYAERLGAALSELELGL